MHKMQELSLNKIKISLDAMGGDNAPRVVIEGASEAKTRYLILLIHFWRQEKDTSYNKVIQQPN